MKHFCIHFNKHEVYVIIKIKSILVVKKPKHKVAHALIPALWEAEAGGPPEVRSLRPGQHSETPSLLKIQKIAGCGGGHL